MRREELPGGARPPKPSTLRRTENLVIPRRAKPDVAIRIPFGTPMIKLLQRRADWQAMSICPRAASISTPSPWKVV